MVHKISDRIFETFIHQLDNFQMYVCVVELKFRQVHAIIFTNPFPDRIPIGETPYSCNFHQSYITVLRAIAHEHPLMLVCDLTDE